MPAMHNSDSSFPIDWPPIQLGEILLEVKDKVGRSRSDDVPILSMTRHDGLVLQSDKFDKRVASRDISNYKIVRRDQIVVGFPIDEGVVYALRRFPIGAVSPAYQVWKVVRGDIDIEFLDTMLKTPLMISRYRQLSSLTVQRRRSLGKQDFLNLEIPLPPLPEQRRIAAVLNAIQDAIAAQEDVIAAARQFKRSLMQRLFTYGPGRVPAETKETLFGDVPGQWEIAALDRCAYVQTGLAKGRRFGPQDKTIKLPYIRVANVQDGYLDLSEIKTVEIRENELERYRLHPGDMLMTEGGDFDKLGRGFVWNGEIKDCLHQNHVFAVRANRERLMPEFLAYLAQSTYGKAYFLSVAHRTTNLASINSTKLKAFPILLPTLAEQSVIVDSLQAADAKLAAEEDRKTALEALFKSMLHQLMTGQIRLLSDEGLPV